MEDKIMKDLSIRIDNKLMDASRWLCLQFKYPSITYSILMIAGFILAFTNLHNLWLAAIGICFVLTSLLSTFAMGERR